MSKRPMSPSIPPESPIRSFAIGSSRSLLDQERMPRSWLGIDVGQEMTQRFKTPIIPAQEADPTSRLTTTGIRDIKMNAEKWLDAGVYTGSVELDGGINIGDVSHRNRRHVSRRDRFRKLIDPEQSRPPGSIPYEGLSEQTKWSRSPRLKCVL